MSCPYDFDAILHSNLFVPFIKRTLIRLRAQRLTHLLRGRRARLPLAAGRNGQDSARSDWVCLNLGCGTSSYAGFINVDVVMRTHLDLLADGRYLPFASETFDQVLCADVIEHMGAQDGRRLLQEVSRILKHTGRLILVTPDLDGIMLAYQNRIASHNQVIQHLYGDQRDHRFLYNQKLLTSAVRSVGLRICRTISGWGPIWAHMVVLAEKS